jgi:rare lipoprotein A
MANGQPYDPMRYTIAHKTIPLGEVVTIVNMRTRQVVVARVTDRGPYVAGRIADMSYITMLKLGLLQDGVGEIEIYRTADAVAQSK